VVLAFVVAVMTLIMIGGWKVRRSLGQTSRQWAEERVIGASGFFRAVKVFFEASNGDL